MSLHQWIQRVLLAGVKLELSPAPAPASPPRVLQPLIDAIEPPRRAFDARAMLFGDRYRSGFWTIYLLSAIAVLFAVLPLALGWDDRRHILHPAAGYWAIGEVLVILTVAMIYRVGHHRDWQGQWLRARTTAELAGYLPLIAPLAGLEDPGNELAADQDWITHVFDPDQPLHGATEVQALCRRVEPLARQCVARAWSSAGFAQDYARWTIGVLLVQQDYHRRVAARHRALRQRIHVLNVWLFSLTALGALLHLVLHTLWLSLVTTFFPALGASLHGALAQSESYRLAVSGERLVDELQAAIDRIRSALAEPSQPDGSGSIRNSIQDALAIVVQEHQDWHMLVQPHHLPLA